ncbi:MAG: stage II sporulation protein M [Candidatus Nanoarchaeia archaeon]|nr:stage II sporulation protein M [Candidatus Nanoarchaeia archaeon]MDD5239254.1 stage II sporulation protein M [Candidatus Nanoarchaeia archaeon]
MVLESIITPKSAHKAPQMNFVLGFMYSAIAIVLAFFIFPSDPSLSVIFLTTLAALPLLINVLTDEQEESMAELKVNNRLPLIKSHLDVFMVFAWMFAGFLACFIIVYIFFPPSFVKIIFSDQIETIQSIVGTSGFFTGPAAEVSGNAINSAAVTAEEGLKVILINNFKVLLFALLFSFLYGAGAIFILAWNASILAVAMGSLVKTKIAALGSLAGFGLIAAYFQAGGVSALRYLIHGIPEISAYFFGAVAGGIISAAVVRSDYRDPKFYEIVLDSIDLIAFASLLLIIGALIEVGITPLFFS